MRSGFRRVGCGGRSNDRLRFHGAIELKTPDGRPLCDRAICTEIGLKDLSVRAPHALPPGEKVQLSIRLPSGTEISLAGRVAWARQTIHPALFGAPRCDDDDADFGIAFEVTSADALLPIIRLFAARTSDQRRANRIRRRYGLPTAA